MNDWEPTFSEDALVDTVLAVASSSMTKDDLVRFFQVNSVPRLNTSGWELGPVGHFRTRV